MGIGLATFMYNILGLYLMVSELLLLSSRLKRR